MSKNIGRGPGGIARPSPQEEPEEIAQAIRAVTEEQKGLIQAVRYARARGFSWARIGTILGVSRQAAQQRFGGVDGGAAQPAAAKSTKPAKARRSTVHHDFSAIAELSTEEIIERAKQLPNDEPKLYDSYLRGLREAIVIELYKRNMFQRQIADVIKKSPQRVSQIVKIHYERIEREWAEERASWDEES